MISFFSLSPNIYGDIKPLSYFNPSVTSSDVSNPLESSTLITPSFPTVSIALAIISPISLLPDEIVATEAISFVDSIFLE